MDKLIKTETVENEGKQEAVFTFETPKTEFVEVVYTEKELIARKEKLEIRIADTQLQIDEDQAELNSINNLINLTK